VTARLLIFLLPNIDDTFIFVFILLLFLNNLVIDSREHHLLLTFRFLVEIFFDLAEPLLSLNSATKTVKSPLLGILLKNQKNQDNQIAIEVIEVSMTLFWAMIDSHPEQVKSDIVEQVH
jgi:hypothetical protein